MDCHACGLAKTDGRPDWFVFVSAKAFDALSLAKPKDMQRLLSLRAHRRGNPQRDLNTQNTANGVCGVLFL